MRQEGEPDNASPKLLAESEVAIPRERLLELIENELWSKFAKRLWGLVSLFLLLATIAGVFGIPYYIENETRRLFASQAQKMDEEQRQLSALAKAYFLIEADYLDYQQKLKADLRLSLPVIEEFEKQHNEVHAFHSASECSAG